MRLRTLALAVALSFGLTAAGEARQKTVVHHPKNKKYKQSKARKVKPRKAPKNHRNA